MKTKFLFVFIVLSISVSGQLNPEDVVYRFFQAMSDIDTVFLEEVLMEDASLSSTSLLNGGEAISRVTKSQFIESVSQAKVGDLNEQVSNLRVEQDGGLANIWMDYSFYYQGQLSHCGVNNFSLALQSGSWKILSLADSRRKVDCIADEVTQAINAMLDQWHLGAASADSTVYFDLMASNSIYVGTDKEEVWSKREFLRFAAPYFAKGKAWAFTKVERNVYSQDFHNVAWFDEVLDTWMGPCRGSGVVVKDNKGVWKVQHYVLSVAIDNDDIKAYLKVIGKK